MTIMIPPTADSFLVDEEMAVVDKKEEQDGTILMLLAQVRRNDDGNTILAVVALDRIILSRFVSLRHELNLLNRGALFCVVYDVVQN
jgi:hypothetical protein